MSVGQALRDKIRYIWCTEKYLAKFRDGHYEVIIDFAHYGLGETCKRACRLFPEIMGMIYATEPMATRRACRVVDIRFLK